MKRAVAVASAADPRETFTIASASISGDGKENGKGLLDQVSKITLNGLSGSDPMDGTTVKLDKLVGNVTVEKLDFPAYRQMMEKINAFTAKYAPQAAIGTEAPPPPPQISDEDRKAMADLVRGFPKLMSAYGYDFSAEGLTVADAQGGVKVHLAQGGLAFGLKAAVGVEVIRANEERLLRRAIAAWSAEPGIEILGNPRAERVVV